MTRDDALARAGETTSGLRLAVWDDGTAGKQFITCRDPDREWTVVISTDPSEPNRKISHETDLDPAGADWQPVLGHQSQASSPINTASS
jgi:hypothetical protein